MADSILRLRVESEEYDNKLKRATEGIRRLAEVAHKGGGELTGLEKAEINYIKALGEMQTQSRTAAGSTRELENAFKELAFLYNQLNDVEKADEGGKALASSLETLKQRAQEAKSGLDAVKQELYGMGNAVEDVKSKSAGLFGEGGLTGMMAVAGGNLLAKGVTMLAGELTDAIGKSIELAKQGEGIRIAFDRLNRTDLLDQLKEATHGTVSELELMKQAVKFNDFNLNLDEMGTLLAFAQQKAKDTGQSVDYMVDSIVTGLGRQSLMILDNLGLSAAEIKERMKEGGDMTSAVASIIKDQMSEAGEYIETAADRAARAAADAANETEAFGRTAAPVAEEWSQTWKTLTIGAMNFANTLLGPIARSIRSIQNILNTNPEDRITGSKYNLFNGYTNQGPATKPTWGDIPVKTAPGGYVEVTDRNTGAVIGGKHFDNLQDTNAIKTWQKTLTKTSGSKSTRTTIKEDKDDFVEIIGLIPNAEEAVRSLQDRIRSSWDEGEIADLTVKLKEAEKELQRLKAIGKENPMVQGLSGFNQKTMSAWLSARNSDLAKAEYGSVDYNNIMSNIADMNTIKTLLEQSIKAGINTADLDMEPLWEKVFDGENIDDSVWQSLADQINEKLKELNIEPIQIDFKTGNVKKQSKEMSKDWKNAASAIQEVGSAMSQIEDPAAKVIGTVAQAVATIALGYAQATTQAAKLGPWAWIAFAATGLATMVSTISAIHSATGYANGGIVEGSGYVSGNSFSGDNTLIRANAGELVLNRAGQSTLISALEGNQNNERNVQPYVNGEQIFLGLTTYLKRSGRGELITSRR